MTWADLTSPARVKTALLALGEQQKGIHQEVDPCQRFIETLTAVLASGAAHVARVDGSVPDNALSCDYGCQGRGSHVECVGYWHVPAAPE